MKPKIFQFLQLALLIVVAIEGGYLIYQNALTSQPSPSTAPSRSKIAPSDERFHPDSVPLRHTSPPLPLTMTFAGDIVPLYLPHVREKLDRELLSNTYYHSRTLLYIKRARRWLPTIDSILTAKDVPTDYKYIPVIESDLSPARSPAGAAGFWQLMPGTARERGLLVDQQVDQRYDVHQATQAAAQYIKHNYRYFGNHLLVAASYNCGRRCMQRYIHRQHLVSHFELDLNSETDRYVYRILAIKLILENPERYGFFVPEDERYPPYRSYTVSIDSSVRSWRDFAQFFGLPEQHLYERNLWIRDNRLYNRSGNRYEVDLPRMVRRDTTFRIDSASDLASFEDLQPADLRNKPDFRGRHRVQAGDRIEQLAAQYQTSVDRLIRANDLRRYALKVGTTLAVPQDSATRPNP